MAVAAADQDKIKRDFCGARLHATIARRLLRFPAHTTDCDSVRLSASVMNRFCDQTNPSHWSNFTDGTMVPNRLDGRIQQAHTYCNQSKKQSNAALLAAGG